MNKFNIFPAIALLSIILFSCDEKVKWGKPPSPGEINKDLIVEQDKLFFKEEKLEVRYIISHDSRIRETDDMIIFLHGINKTEYEWVEKGSFGEIYYEVIRQKNILRTPVVVSISLGAAYFFLDGAPKPYNADLEKMLLDKIIPHFRDKLGKRGRIFLIGHSMGGYNALSLSLRNPETFTRAVVISPFVAPYSPFSREFDEKGRELKLPKLQIKVLKKTLIKAFKTEERWNEYNPFYLIKNFTKKTYPLFFISRAQNDLPGFSESINDFISLLNRNRVINYNCLSEGDHQTTCRNIFIEFLEKY